MSWRNGKQLAGIVTLSSEAVLSAGAGKARVRMPVAGRIVGVTASVLSAPAGSSAIFDVNKNGTSIYGTQANRPTIAAGAVSATAGAASVLSFAAGDVITVDVDQIGSGTAGTGFTVAIAYRGANL
jgi:hypothetical protein